MDFNLEQMQAVEKVRTFHSLHYVFCVFLQIKSEIPDSIVVADALDDILQCFLVVRILAVLYPAAYQLTHDAAEVLVAGVRKEASGVGEHANEVAKAAQVCQTGHLGGHTLLVIIEPPCGALLQLAHYCRILEASQDSADGSIVIGVQGVEDGLWDLIGSA